MRSRAANQFRALLRGGTGLQAAVNEITVPPPVQARPGNPQRLRRIADSAAGPGQIKGAAAEFGWIRSRHRLILSDRRTPTLSRHASPRNRVKRPMCPRYEGKPTAIGRSGVTRERGHHAEADVSRYTPGPGSGALPVPSAAISV